MGVRLLLNILADSDIAVDAEEVFERIGQMSPSYKLKIHRDVEKQLQRIPRNQRNRLVESMRALRHTPRPPGCVKLDNVLIQNQTGSIPYHLRRI